MAVLDQNMNMNLTSPYGYSSGMGGTTGMPGGNVGGAMGPGGGVNALNFSPNMMSAGLPFMSGLSSIAGGFLGQQGNQQGIQNMLNQLQQSPQMWQQFMQQTQQQYQPYQQLGTNALNALQNPQQSFQASPGYQYATQQASEEMNRQAAARGNYFAPSTTSAIAERVQGMGMEDYNNWVQQMMQQAGMGYGATGAVSGFGYGATGQESNINNLIAQLKAQQAQQPGAVNMLNQLPGLISSGASLAALIP